MTIYFAAVRKRVKIGYTRGPVEKRLKGISSHLSEPLKLLATLEGGTALERAIHDELKPFWKKGEWFRDCPELRARIAEICANPPAPKPAVDAPRLGPPRRLTDAEYGQMIARVASLVWPHDALRQMAAFTELPEEVVRAWFDGESLPSPVVRGAFAARVLQFCFS